MVNSCQRILTAESLKLEEPENPLPSSSLNFYLANYHKILPPGPLACFLIQTVSANHTICQDVHNVKEIIFSSASANFSLKFL